jgi:hypothetical protein
MNKDAYTPPTIEVVGTLHELTLTIPKHLNHKPDGFSFQPPGGPVFTLTS